MDGGEEDGFRRGRRERVEIHVGVERRRRWSREEKLRIVRESLEPDANVGQVARRNEVSASLIYVWRRQALAGLIDGFHQVRVVPEATTAVVVAAPEPAASMASRKENPEPIPPAPALPSAGSIELTLSDGTALRVDGAVGPEMLRILLAKLVRS